MTTFFEDEVSRLPGETVIPAAGVEANNPAWTLTNGVWSTTVPEQGVAVLDWWATNQAAEHPLTPRMTYLLAATLTVSEDVDVRWLVHVTYEDQGTGTLADGAANVDPTTRVPAGDPVETARQWTAPQGVASGSFTIEITGTPGTTVTLAAPVAAPLDGPLSVGNVVGATFRTSDDLPGQVTFSDTAAEGAPGISIAPVNASGMVRLPYIAPGLGGISVFGGESGAGDSAEVYARPTYAGMYGSGADGSWSRVQATKHIAGLTRSGTGGDTGTIQVYPGFSVVECVWEGVTRTLSVGSSGFRMTTVAGGVTTTVNLGELADRIASLEARVTALEA